MNEEIVPMVEINEDEFASAEDLLEGAKSDIQQDVVTDVFGGKKVQVRSLTAAENARVNQGSITIGGGRRGRNTEFNWAASEMAKFRYGVLKPQLTADQVRQLHMTSGPSFQKVLKRVDELSGTRDEDIEADEEQFRGSGE
jgi:hypothetical protein